ncbi:hypothetical protein [Streptomyces nigrescens]|uniref:hypothetical protein n=1 Tax=Streptomyces nigrescens TaxID=1920 RepID=UPI0036A7D6C3
MIAIIRTTWAVSAASYAADNGVSEGDVFRELGWYISSSINDLPAMADSGAWARCLPTPNMPAPDGQAKVRIDWQVEVRAAAWLQARELHRCSARRDLCGYLTHELYHLPSICETDAIMTVTYNDGHGKVHRTFRPADRRRA